jgi:hypothetical protein
MFPPPMWLRLSGARIVSIILMVVVMFLIAPTKDAILVLMCIVEDATIIAVTEKGESNEQSYFSNL